MNKDILKKQLDNVIALSPEEIFNKYNITEIHISMDNSIAFYIDPEHNPDHAFSDMVYTFIAVAPNNTITLEHDDYNAPVDDFITIAECEVECIYSDFVRTILLNKNLEIYPYF